MSAPQLVQGDGPNLQEEKDIQNSLNDSIQRWLLKSELTTQNSGQNMVDHLDQCVQYRESDFLIFFPGFIIVRKLSSGRF